MQSTELLVFFTMYVIYFFYMLIKMTMKMISSAEQFNLFRPAHSFAKQEQLVVLYDIQFPLAKFKTRCFLQVFASQI